MPDYRTPLPGILAAMLETGINRVLMMDEKSPERLHQLDGRMLRLDLEGLGISLFFAFDQRRVEVGTRSQAEPDTVIAGSPMALFAMAVPDGAEHWGTPESRVTISGDANLARDLERLFSRLDPDWEGRLARLLGDVWGHQVAAGIRTSASQLRESAENAGDMLAEFLQGGGSPLARPEDVRSFAASVEEAAGTVDELEERLTGLERKRQ